MDRDASWEREHPRGVDPDEGLAGSLRDAPPDPFAPIDPGAPVSGHIPAPEAAGHPASHAPEQEWSVAAGLIVPALRPVGTQGVPLSEIDPDALAESAGKTHTQPLLEEGPCGLAVVYAMAGGGFDVIVNADHLLSWRVPTAEVHDTAMRNLAEWSARAPWTHEFSGHRRLLSSDTGDGNDAARILLPEVRDHLARELGLAGRVLVGLPERHLLLAGTIRPQDQEFAQLFAEFVIEHSGGADEPIDRRVFELVDGQLVEFAG